MGEKLKLVAAALAGLGVLTGAPKEVGATAVLTMQICLEPDKKGTAQVIFPNGTRLMFPVQTMRDKNLGTLNHEDWGITRSITPDKKELFTFKREFKREGKDSFEEFGFIVDNDECRPATS